MSPTPQSALVFTADELDLLGRTADALSAYMGKPVLAEVVDAQETGFEWVLFGVPLGTEEDVDQQVIVQIGGADARILGNSGGLALSGDDVFDCEYLWAIQLSDLEGVRFIKLDQEGDEVAWTDNLNEILPFALVDVAPAADDLDDDDDSDAGDEDPIDPEDHHVPKILH